MDVRAENRGRPHQNVRFPAAPVVGRNFWTPGHLGVRSGMSAGNPDQKVHVYAVFFFPESKDRKRGKGPPSKKARIGGERPHPQDKVQPKDFT